jgi:hypothetical protein
VTFPPLTTAPLASVKVIEPIEFASGSHPGVTDADADRPSPAMLKITGINKSGANIAASVTRRVVRPPTDNWRSTRRRKAWPRRTAVFTSHPKGVLL